MKRDGALESLWQQEPVYVSQHNSFPAQNYDVVIAGGGITGLTTALQLQKAGKKCIVIEAKNLCFGTTGGTTAHLNSFLDTSYQQIKDNFGEEDAQLVARALNDALDLAKKNVTNYQIDCGYEEKDGYVFSQDEKQTSELNDMLQTSKNAGVVVDFINQIPVPIQFDKAIVYRAQAQLHPTKYVHALAKAFEELGGVIVQNCRVAKVSGSDPITIETSLGQLQSEYFIWATHTPPGVNLLHFRIAPYRSYAMAIKLADGHYPDGLAYDMYDPYHYYRTQEVDGEKYLIAGGEDHKTAHEENTGRCFTELESYLRKHFSISEVTHRWSSQYFEPADGLAYIGHLPGNPDKVLVACGFGGNGITYGHVSAILLSDIIIKGSSDYEKLFSPSRVKPVAGFANFVKENVDVVKEFVSKRLGQTKIKELSELAAGEAKLVKYEGESIALYKDESGQIHAVNPTCPHALCVVGWNSAEKSWDCPCHGSRFSFDGELLTGPARSDLERIDFSSET